MSNELKTISEKVERIENMVATIYSALLLCGWSVLCLGIISIIHKGILLFKGGI